MRSIWFMTAERPLRVLKRSESPGAQLCSGVVKVWRAGEDETGHCYVIVIAINSKVC